MNSLKGRSEEVANSLDVTLRHIFTYRFDRERKILIGQRTDYDGGGVT